MNEESGGGVACAYWCSCCAGRPSPFERSDGAATPLGRTAARESSIDEVINDELVNDKVEAQEPTDSSRLRYQLGLTAK